MREKGSLGGGTQLWERKRDKKDGGMEVRGEGGRRGSWGRKSLSKDGRKDGLWGRRSGTKG